MHEIITSTDIYWITRLDKFSSVATVFACILSVLSVVIFCASHDSDFKAPPKWLLPFTLCGAMFCIFASMMIPTTKEAIAILVIPKIANNEDIQGIGSDLVKVAKEWVEELKPQHKEPPSK